MKDTRLNNIKNTGFKTPEHYFEKLDDTISSKLFEAQLSDTIKSSGFKVPVNYFDSVDNTILDAITDDGGVKVVSIPSWKKIAYISGIAASIILALNFLFEKPNQLSFGNLETASIETYLLNEDLTAYDIAPYLNTSDLDVEHFVDSDVNASAIEDYLLQNSDFEQLIED